MGGFLALICCAGACFIINPMDAAILSGKYYFSPFEPYYRIEYIIDDKPVVYIQNDGNNPDAGFQRINEELVFQGGHVGLWLTVICDSERFQANSLYNTQSLDLLNKYGHLCSLDGDGWLASFTIGGEKAYDLYQVQFEGDCVDPDTGQIYKIRDGVLTVCKNNMPANWKHLSDYLQ